MCVPAIQVSHCSDCMFTSAQVSRLERASMDPMLFVAALKDSAHQTALEGYAQMRNSFLRMPTHLPTAQVARDLTYRVTMLS